VPPRLAMTMPRVRVVGAEHVTFRPALLHGRMIAALLMVMMSNRRSGTSPARPRVGVWGQL